MSHKLSDAEMSEMIERVAGAIRQCVKREDFSDHELYMMEDDIVGKLA